MVSQPSGKRPLSAFALLQTFPVTHMNGQQPDLLLLSSAQT